MTLAISAPINVAWYDAHVRHTHHSIDRFIERAQPPAGLPAAALLRDLAGSQGRLVDQRPHWGRSRRTADAYLQIGEFLVLLLEADQRRPGCFSCVTVINGASWKTWEAAYERGWVAVAPPAPKPLVWTSRQLEEIRRGAWQDALASVGAERSPAVRGRWLSQARKQSRADRSAFLADQQRRVRAMFDRLMVDVRAEHARDLAALDDWERVARPAYQAQLQRARAANLA